MKVAVLGGGISGLSCAYYLLKYGADKLSQVILVEASKRVGGWIDTRKFDDGVIFEVGPKSIRPFGIVGMNTLSLVSELGLENELVHYSRKNLAARNRYIWHDNQMHVLPNSVSSLFKSNTLFDKPFYRYLLNDLRRNKLDISDDDDISFYDFMSQRFGEDFAKFACDPLCRGIVAGDCRKLSVKSLFPQLYKDERTYGSVVKGTLLSSMSSRKSKYFIEAANYSLVRKSMTEKWASWSLKEGLSQLPETLLKKLNTFGDKFVNKVGHKCDHLMYKEDGSAVMHISNSTSIKPTSVDHVISTLPAPQLANCLSSKKYPDLCQTLKSTRHVPVAVVCLQYDGVVLPREHGFGFLTPSFSKEPILGIVFDSCTFPHHDAGKEITRLTVMMGGEWFEDLFGDPSTADSDKFVEIAKKSIYNCLNIKEQPSRTIVAIHKECIPQYYLGHEDKLNRISSLINEYKINLDFTGFSYRGVGVNDNIMNARKLAENFLTNK